MNWRRKLALAAGVISVLALTACDNGPSAVSQQQAAGEQMASAAPPSMTRRDDEVDHRNDPVPELDGKAIWAASKRLGAQDSAQRAFDRNGSTFGAKDLKDYVRKAHAFVENPPKGVETLKRANGDTLFYDARANIFAVANKDGAPRTMFKPDEGSAYWQEQKDREAKRQVARAERRAQQDDET